MSVNEELPNDTLMSRKFEGSLCVRGRPHQYQRELSSDQELSSNYEGLHSALNFKKEPVELSNKSLVPQTFYWRNIFGHRISRKCLPDCKTATLFLVSSQILTVVLREEEIFISWDRLGKVWQVSDLHCSIEVLRNVRVEKEVGLHPPVQTEGDDPVLVETQPSHDVLHHKYQANILMDFEWKLTT